MTTSKVTDKAVVEGDDLIVARALAGDTEAFGELVCRWERRIFGLAYGMLGNMEDARDVAQETFFSAFQNLSGFRGEAKVSSWLHRIAINQCITRQRRAKVRAEMPIEDDSGEIDSVVFAVNTFESPASPTESTERAEIVRRAVSALPVELREVVVMKEFEEMTFQEMSEILDLPLSTVKSRLYSALKQLRLRLEKYGLVQNEQEQTGFEVITQ
ncbi:MAG: RNA polymerase sigma factor [Pyrinomonadaceae bacterium]